MPFGSLPLIELGVLAPKLFWKAARCAAARILLLVLAYFLKALRRIFSYGQSHLYLR